jgi:hypothetical protein
VEVESIGLLIELMPDWSYSGPRARQARSIPIMPISPSTDRIRSTIIRRHDPGSRFGPTTEDRVTSKNEFWNIRETMLPSEPEGPKDNR